MIDHLRTLLAHIITRWLAELRGWPGLASAWARPRGRGLHTGAGLRGDL